MKMAWDMAAVDGVSVLAIPSPSLILDYSGIHGRIRGTTKRDFDNFTTLSECTVWNRKSNPRRNVKQTS